MQLCKWAWILIWGDNVDCTPDHYLPASFDWLGEQSNHSPTLTYVKKSLTTSNSSPNYDNSVNLCVFVDTKSFYFCQLMPKQKINKLLLVLLAGLHRLFDCFLRSLHISMFSTRMVSANSLVICYVSCRNICTFACYWSDVFGILIFPRTSWIATWLWWKSTINISWQQ